MNNTSENNTSFIAGIRDGVPVALGYFAVAFSLGIMCRHAQMLPWQGFLFSLLNLTSAGEFAAVTLMIEHAGYAEAALITLIANARYLLMSAALSQRLAPGTSLLHRLSIAYGVTDELFGIAISKPAPLNPRYFYGAVAIAAPGWALGTALGIVAGQALPVSIVSALSVALFGMFLAVIVPPAKKSTTILVTVLISFAASYAAGIIPFLAQYSGGTRTIILTVLISAIAAYLKPVNEEEQEAAHE